MEEEGIARELASLRALQARLGRRVAVLEARREEHRRRSAVDAIVGAKVPKGEVGEGEEVADEQLEKEANELLGNIQEEELEGSIADLEEVVEEIEVLDTEDTMEDDEEEEEMPEMKFKQHMSVGEPSKGFDEMKDGFVEVKEEVNEELPGADKLELPAGWMGRRRWKGSAAAGYRYTAPCGAAFNSLVQALDFMATKGCGEEDIVTMRGNLRLEGWREAAYLPAGWLVLYYKPTNKFHYYSDHGQLFLSAKRAMEAMASRHMNPDMIAAVRRNMVESKRFTGRTRYKWQEGGDSLPAGWQRRRERGKGAAREWVELVLSRDGVQFRSRQEALLYMLRHGYPGREVEELRGKLVESGERWREHLLLPAGWLWKWKGESATREKDPKSTSLTLISREGAVFHTVKAAVEAMADTGGYTEADGINCYKFLKAATAPVNSNKPIWEQGEGLVPGGWKVKSGGQGYQGYQAILSPEGISYKTRYVAVQDMRKRGCSQQDIETMKEKMVEAEGWESHPFLPTGWLFKKGTQGFSKSKGNWQSGSNKYITKEGLAIDSMKNAKEHIQGTEGYRKEDLENCARFIKEQTRGEEKHSWGDGEGQLPAGWRIRRTGAGEDLRFQAILSPEGITYKTRYVAVQDMQTRGYSQQDIEAMKEKMVEFEGWERHPLLPTGWLVKKGIPYKMKSGRRSLGSNKYITKEGLAFGSMKTAMEHIQGTEGYSKEDLENCARFTKEQNRSEETYEWSKGDESLPAGWKMRNSGAYTYILSPGSHQYRSRFVAIQDMRRRGCSVEEVEGMRGKMVEHEGWRPSDLLPQGWLYKVIWEGFCEQKGSNSQKILFLSREVQAFDSTKKAITFISDNPDYTKEDKDNLEEFRKTQMNPGRKYEWLEGGDSLPAGWKVRAVGGEGQVSMIMSPEGKAFRSRFYAVQELLRRGEQGQVVESLRLGMVAEEGWTASTLLPPSWLYKLTWEGFSDGGKSHLGKV